MLFLSLPVWHLVLASLSQTFVPQSITEPLHFSPSLLPPSHCINPTGWDHAYWHQSPYTFLYINHTPRVTRFLLGFLDPCRWDRQVVPKRRKGITKRHCVISWNTADVTYFAAEAWVTYVSPTKTKSQYKRCHRTKFPMLLQHLTEWLLCHLLHVTLTQVPPPTEK